MLSAPQVREKLKGYPSDIFLHYDAFLKDSKEENLAAFVISLIRFLQDSFPTGDSRELSNATRLREDLQIDSITFAEVVFLLEDILEIEIDNRDLMELSTIGDLKQYILGKLS